MVYEKFMNCKYSTGATGIYSIFIPCFFAIILLTSCALYIKNVYRFNVCPCFALLMTFQEPFFHLCVQHINIIVLVTNCTFFDVYKPSSIISAVFHWPQMIQMLTRIIQNSSQIDYSRLIQLILVYCQKYLFLITWVLYKIHVPGLSLACLLALPFLWPVCSLAQTPVRIQARLNC